MCCSNIIHSSKTLFDKANLRTFRLHLGLKSIYIYINIYIYIYINIYIYIYNNDNLYRAMTLPKPKAKVLYMILVPKRLIKQQCFKSSLKYVDWWWLIGKLFHKWGTSKANAHLSNSVRVLGTMRTPSSAVWIDIGWCYLIGSSWRCNQMPDCWVPCTSARRLLFICAVVHEANVGGHVGLVSNGHAVIHLILVSLHPGVKHEFD